MDFKIDHSIGETISVMIDGTTYSGPIKELHIVVRENVLLPNIAYMAEVSKEFKDKQKDGTFKLRTDIRNWMGPDKDIL